MSLLNFMLMEYIDCHAEIVREVSTDEDEEKAESEENVPKRVRKTLHFNFPFTISFVL